MIHPIRLPLANAYLFMGERPILVDTGAPGDTDRIVQALKTHGVTPADLALILLTHGHGDHAGSAAALQKLTNAPLMVHKADLEMVQTGHNRPFQTTSLEAKLIKPFVDKPFPPVIPDIVIDGPTDLAEFGLAGQLLHTPGHTLGSLTLLIEDKPNTQPAAIAGDLLMGGRMGGALWARRPQPHYFVESPALLAGSLQQVLSKDPHTLYVGHGGPLTGQRVQQWHQRQQ